MLGNNLQVFLWLYRAFKFELTVSGYSVVDDWDRHQRQRCLSAGLAASKWIPVDIFNSA